MHNVSSFKAKSIPSWEILLISFLQSVTIALLWTLELAHAQHFLDIIVEGDAKVCIEAISQSTEAIPWPWRIMPLISNVKCLALNFFFSYCFCWVRCDANVLAHLLVKFVFTQPIYPLCNPANLPPFACEA